MLLIYQSLRNQYIFLIKPGYKDNNYIFSIIDNFMTTISLFITLIIMLYSYIRKLYIFKDKQYTIK